MEVVPVAQKVRLIMVNPKDHSLYTRGWLMKEIELLSRALETVHTLTISTISTTVQVKL